MQRQPSRGALRKKYSENMQQIYRRTKSLNNMPLILNLLENNNPPPPPLRHHHLAKHRTCLQDLASANGRKLIKP